MYFVTAFFDAKISTKNVFVEPDITAYEYTIHANKNELKQNITFAANFRSNLLPMLSIDTI